MRPGALCGLFFLTAACAPVPEVERGPRPDTVQAHCELTADGGTLRTEQFTVELQDTGLRMRVTPLDRAVLRLASPDTFLRLTALAGAARQALAPGALTVAQTSLFLVSFQSTESDREFQPEAFTLESRGQRLRPFQIQPLTPGWGSQRLHAHSAEAAVYVFDRPVPPFQPFTVRYGMSASEAWRNVIPLLLSERHRLGGC